MEERQENLLFNDTFRFKDLPDTTTPHNAPNMNIALDNTSYLKQELDNKIQELNKMSSILKNLKVTGEYTILKKETVVSSSELTKIGTCYTMKQYLLRKFPKKAGYNRNISLLVEATDSFKSGCNCTIVLRVNGKDYEFNIGGFLGGSNEETLGLYFPKTDVTFDDIEEGHVTILAKINQSDVEFRIHRLFWFIEDTPVL